MCKCKNIPVKGILSWGCKTEEFYYYKLSSNISSVSPEPYNRNMVEGKTKEICSTLE
jgi:hypothetical protein